jgi:hypothetical protein
MYKSDEGMIYWCTHCSRICSGHRHYTLTTHDVKAEEVEERVNNFDFFGNQDACKRQGGGGIDEKIARIRRMREYALQLEADIGTKDTREAMKELVEETWDAPIKPYNTNLLKKIRTKRAWNISSNRFHSNAVPEAAAEAAAAAAAVPAWNGVYPNAGIHDRFPLIHLHGYDPVAMDDVDFAIQFRHRLPTGEVNQHNDSYIGIDNLFGTVLKERTKGESRGRCWNYPDCNAFMYPAELEYILEHVNDGGPEKKVTEEKMREYRTQLDIYTKAFRSARLAGGRRRKTRKTRHQNGGADERFTIGPATLAECALAGGGRKTLRKKHRRNISRKR